MDKLCTAYTCLIGKKKKKHEVISASAAMVGTKNPLDQRRKMP